MGEANFYYFTCLKFDSVICSVNMVSFAFFAMVVVLGSVSAGAEVNVTAAESMMLGTISTSGSHGCIDCVIDKCHHCLCREALKRSPNGVANVIDPYNKAKNQYLVCEGNRITCHPCPKGLVWNCRNQVCDKTSDCPDIPEKCWCDCGRSRGMTKTMETVSAATVTSVTTTSNSKTATTTSFNPVHVPIPLPHTSNVVRKYVTETVANCFKLFNGQKMSVPCEQVDMMLNRASVSVWADKGSSFPGSASNTTTIKTTSPCSGVTTTTTSAVAGNGACSSMTTTISVNPCKSGAGQRRESTELVYRDYSAFQRCLCEEAMKTCSRPARSICDPKADNTNMYLTCLRDGRVVPQFCPVGTSWDYMAESCSVVGKCQPIPVACLKYKFL